MKSTHTHTNEREKEKNKDETRTQINSDPRWPSTRQAAAGHTVCVAASTPSGSKMNFPAVLAETSRYSLPKYSLPHTSKNVCTGLCGFDNNSGTIRLLNLHSSSRSQKTKATGRTERAWYTLRAQYRRTALKTLADATPGSRKIRRVDHKRRSDPDNNTLLSLPRIVRTYLR